LFFSNGNRKIEPFHLRLPNQISKIQHLQDILAQCFFLKTASHDAFLQEKGTRKPPQ
jgi:hypothetical protein